MTDYSYAQYNPPPAGATEYDVNSAFYADCSSLTANDGYIVYMPNGVNFHPGTILLSDTDNTTIEYSCDDQATLAANTNVYWQSQTPAALMVIASPISAVRVTNTGDGAITVKIMV